MTPMFFLSLLTKKSIYKIAEMAVLRILSAPVHDARSCRFIYLRTIVVACLRATSELSPEC